MGSTLQDLLKKKADLKPVESTANEYQLLPTTTNPYQVVPSTTKKPDNVPTSPQKNFTKVPNSVTSEAIPQGLFKGLSKHTYDVLYKLTRGAINPARSVQLTRLELMKLTGLSENTQRVHIKYLSVAGLLKVAYQTGKHEGATYEVFVPEEIENTFQVLPSTTNQYQVLPSTTNDSQNLGGDKYQRLGVVSSTLTPEITGSNDALKTSLKTNTIDDEATRIFASVVREKFGREITKSEIADLPLLFDFCAGVLRGAKTDKASNAVKLLITMFEREIASKLSTEKGDKQTASTKKNDKIFVEVTEPYKAEPMSDEAKINALETLRTILADGKPIEPFRGNYTEIDWKFLTKELEN
jgi:hypothetical protein